MVPHSTTEMIDHAAELGFEVMAVTNHDFMSHTDDLADYAAWRGVLLIPGVEATIENRHVLLYNFDYWASVPRTFEDVARRSYAGAGLPPGADHLISDRRLSDWLQLLDMRIHAITRYFFRWPLPGNKGSSSQVWESRGRRFWPELAACYMLTAQKRVFTLTPMKKPWRARPKVVGGIVEPTTRVSRIRFDRNS